MDENTYNIYRFFKGESDICTSSNNEMNASLNNDKWMEENWEDYLKDRKTERERFLNDFLSNGI